MLLCSVAFFATPSVVLSGEAVTVDQRVHVTRSAAAGLLGPGTQIRTGDRITTDQNGLAQIVFPDGTKLVIGPNTMMRVEDYSLGAQGQVRRVRLNATRGSFRFIAGTNIAAYSVQTPGGLVRPQNGTVDVAAGGTRGAYVVTLGGEALMCDAHHRCTIVRGNCTFASADGAGGFGLASTNGRERRQLLQELFPNIINQSRLTSGFEASVQACGFMGLQRSPARVSAGFAPTATPTPTPTPPGTPVSPTSPTPGHGGSGGGGAAAAAASGGGGSGGGGAAAAAAGSAAAAAAASGSSSGGGSGSGGGAAAAAAGGGGTSGGGAAASASSSPGGGAAAAASSGGSAASATGD